MSEIELQQAQNNFKAENEKYINVYDKAFAETPEYEPQKQASAQLGDILGDKSMADLNKEVPHQQHDSLQTQEKADLLLQKVAKTGEQALLEPIEKNDSLNVEVKQIQQLNETSFEQKNTQTKKIMQIHQKDITQQNSNDKQPQELLQHIQPHHHKIGEGQQEKAVIIEHKQQNPTEAVGKKYQLQATEKLQQDKHVHEQDLSSNIEKANIQPEKTIEIIGKQKEGKVQINEPISLQNKKQAGNPHQLNSKVSQLQIQQTKQEIVQSAEGHIQPVQIHKTNIIIQKEQLPKNPQKQQLNLAHKPLENHSAKHVDKIEDKAATQTQNIINTSENLQALHHHHQIYQKQFVPIQGDEKQQINNCNPPVPAFDQKQKQQDPKLTKTPQILQQKQQKVRQQIIDIQPELKQETQQPIHPITGYQTLKIEKPEKKNEQIFIQDQHHQSKQVDISEEGNKYGESKTIEVHLPDEHQEKQKYRLHSQYVESIPEQRHDEKQVILFTQFSQNEEPARTKTEQPANLVHIEQEKDSYNVSFQTKAVNQNEGQLKKASGQLDSIDQKHEPHKIIIPKEQKKQQKAINDSPKKEGVGKISKRTLYQKKVYDIVKDLTKYDENKNVIPILEQVKRSKKKINLSKLDSHIGLQSNVMNLTIGQIMSKNEDAQANKLLEQIDLLKQNLKELERKKEDRQYESPSMIQENANNTINSNKKNKKQMTGRIYRKFDNEHSRVSEQINNSSQKQGNSIPTQHFSVNSAPRKRFSSTNGFQGFKPKQEEIISQFGKKVAPSISFRVKRPSKSTYGQTDFGSLQKQTGFIKNKEKNEQDQCFQARPLQNYDQIQFNEEEKVNLIQRPSPKKLDFTPNFREEVQRYFLVLNCETPKKDWSQQQLVELAKNVFTKFGVNLQADRVVSLGVKKYKNCVSFTLDSDRTILWYYEGKFYYGGWIINTDGEGQKNGWGYEQNLGKYVYNGAYKQNKKQGYGVIKLLSKQSDIVYEGFWANGLKEGFGKQLQSDGIQYVGSWHEGKKHGQGKLKISEKQSFAGHFVRGVKSGHGKEFFKNGDTYEGEYVDGKFSGKGVYTWANFSRYEGQFKNGARNGQGLWTGNYVDPNSDKYEGQYKNDKKSGFGLYRWKDGTSYEGEFLNDLKHGEGVVSYGDGRTAKLQWCQGAVVPRQVNRAASSKKGTNQANSQKSESSKKQKTGQKHLISQLRSKPTRISFGMQKI